MMYQMRILLECDSEDDAIEFYETIKESVLDYCASEILVKKLKLEVKKSDE